MSLLMQALKKAERAKQSHAADEELAKPSEAFDQKLAPQPPAPNRELELELAALTPEPPSEPLDLSLEPFGTAQAPPAGSAAAPRPAPEPSAMASDASHPPPQPARNLPPPPQAVRSVIRRPSLTLPDPRIVRALTLAAFVLLVAAVFGYIYWRAVYGPGSSRNLPMVPMPGQDIPPAGATAGAAIVYAPASAPIAPEPNASPQAAADVGQSPAASYIPPAGPPANYPAAQAPAAAPAASYVPPAGPAVSYPAAQGPAAAPAATAPLAAAPLAPASRKASKANPAAAIPNAAEEISRIKQENLERAERMQRMLDMGDPNRPSGPPPPPYVPPASSTTPATATAATGAAYAPAAAAPPAYTPAAPDNAGGIRVARSSKPEQVNPGLLSGYTAFNRGDFGAAQQQYQAVLQQDPNNRDALLGNAALALQARQPEQAAAIYARLLDLDPNDGDALAGLMGLRAGDPAQTEGRLRRALAQSPESPALLFALGNLYARHGRWQEAQQQYFKAFANAPANADYAFNLAVGLDRLGQRKLALGYYQRALALAVGAAANFDRNAAAARIRELGGQ